MKNLKIKAFALAILALMLTGNRAGACTGITLKAKDGSIVLARTCEWGGSNLESRYVIVPRSHTQTSLTPSGQNGLVYTTRYGYAGISVMQDSFVTEGLNEKGLSAGLFFFPGYGQYEEYSSGRNSSTMVDVELVGWMLGNFSTVEEVKEAIGSVHIVATSPEAGTAHWRIADATGAQAVLEIIGGEPRFYDNKLGVLTNSPGFEWQMTNLNNYVNLFPGQADPLKLTYEVTLRQFGAGAGFLGIPGDVTPPSRFVRAAFYKATAPQYGTSFETVKETFQILNNFDIPIGVEHGAGKAPADIPSATQWTTSSDQSALRLYYRTAWNSTIRCIDLKTIDFGKVAYQVHPLDKVQDQPVEVLKIK
ncbi:MAG: choloylglycine hydrolase family protein [Bacteroidetes bacterium]|uniref:Choloylglycine hydrolase family protein n=1 Tax=Candidatus Cryptobacteroides faecavium TaxID=2840762 RepID=A0A9D9IEX6_9BACT|nr:choloylglycine hydrolase family protein [Candidatus Cryptobacteroides faecavium]